MKWNTVKGSFSGMQGTVSFSPEDLTSSVFDVCIDANTVDTGNKKRDNHLKKEDFLNEKKHGQICIKSTKIIRTASGYKFIGTLTMNGIANEVEIPFTYFNNQITGNFKLNRFHYKIGEDTGNFLVGQEISINIICVLNFP